MFERQLASGLLPEGTDLSERPHWVPAWDSLTADEQRLYARMMEVFAGFMTHTDAQVGRVLDFLDQLGELDDTIVLLMSDNGASAEGGARGSFNEQYFFNVEPEDLDENLRRIDDLGGPGANNHYPWGWAWAGNTPLKRFKRDTHEGGVADPLVVHWPARLGTDGGTRHQYVHAIDVMPTLLDLIGIEPPAEIAGVAQSPIEGVSFAPSLDRRRRARAPTSRSTTRCSGPGRSTTTAGRRSCSTPRRSWPTTAATARSRSTTTSGSCTTWPRTSPRSTTWRPANPRSWPRCRTLWWSEAEKYKVLPLNNQPGRFGDKRYARARYELYGGTSPLPESLAPNLRNRSWEMLVELDVPDGGAPDGVVVAQGGLSGGYVLHLVGNRLRYTYNFLGSTITPVTAERELAPGAQTVRVSFVSDGGFGAGGEVTLAYGDDVVATGRIPRTTPITYGMHGFAVGSQPSSPIDPSLHGRCALPTTVLGKVVIEVDPARPVPKDAEVNADLAQQ